MEFEREFAGEDRFALRLEICRVFFHHLFALVEGAHETFFLAGHDLLDEGALCLKLRVCFAAGVDDDIHEVFQERILHADLAAVARSSADESSEDVSSALVARHDLIADHKCRGANMVRDDAQGYVDLLIAALIADTRHLFRGVQDFRDRIDIEDGIHILHDARKAFQTHTGIDVLLDQIAVVALAVVVKLCEDVVPELDVSVAVAARFAVGLAAAVLFAAVEVDLRARAARTAADLPEVVVLAETHNALFRHTDLILPDVVRFVVIQIDRRPELIDRHFHHFGHEFPAPGERFFLKIISKGKTPQHLEECAVARCVPDILDVQCADALLAGRHALRRRLLDACEIRLHRRHSRVDDQKALVVLRDQREAVESIMLLALVELQKLTANGV